MLLRPLDPGSGGVRTPRRHLPVPARQRGSPRCVKPLGFLSFEWQTCAAARRNRGPLAGGAQIEGRRWVRPEAYVKRRGEFALLSGSRFFATSFSTAAPCRAFVPRAPLATTNDRGRRTGCEPIQASDVAKLLASPAGQAPQGQPAPRSSRRQLTRLCHGHPHHPPLFRPGGMELSCESVPGSRAGLTANTLPSSLWRLAFSSWPSCDGEWSPVIKACCLVVQSSN